MGSPWSDYDAGSPAWSCSNSPVVYSSPSKNDLEKLQQRTSVSLAENIAEELNRIHSQPKPLLKALCNIFNSIDGLYLNKAYQISLGFMSVVNSFGVYGDLSSVDEDCVNQIYEKLRCDLYDDSSDFYQRVNQSWTGAGLTFFGEKHILSFASRTLQRLQCVVEKEQSNQNYSRELRNSIIENGK